MTKGEKKFYLGTFLILGEAKCGTTALYEFINQHPRVIRSVRKENRLLRRVGARLSGYADYSQIKHKDLVCIRNNYYNYLYPKNKRGGKDRFYLGEASGYMKDEWSIKILKTIVPDAKKIILLRNPADRLYSWYWHSKKKGKVIRKDSVKKLNFEKELNRYLKINQNDYYANIKMVSNHFDLNEILFIKSEDLYSNVQGVMNNVFKHLGLKPIQVAGLKINPGMYTESLRPETREFILDYFDDMIINLERLLDRRFEWE